MNERDTFERRLTDALQAYAADAPIDLDTPALAQSIAVRDPRRRPWSSTVRRLALVPAGWVVLGVALLLAALLGLTAAGVLRRDDAVPPPAPFLMLPSDVYGEWQASVPQGAAGDGPGGTYTLDLNAPSMVRGPAGEPVEWLGRTSAATRAAGAIEIAVRSSGACGEGRYALNESFGAAPPENGGPSAAPPDESPTPGFWEAFRLTRLADPCSERVAILTAGPWRRTPLLGPELGPFTAGQTYSSGVFTEPFTFVMPIVDSSGENAGLPDQFRTAHRYVSDAGLWFGGPWWSMVIVDDAPVLANLCDRDGAVLPGVPSTPDAVLEWYRSSGLRTGEPVEIAVDGRTALRFDLLESEAPCDGTRLPLGGYYPYSSRAYAIPTGDDTILIVFGSDGVNWEAVKAAVEALVLSMDFE